MLPAAIKMPLRGKSGKKPLTDVSNQKYARTSSKSVTKANTKEDVNRSKVEEQDDSLDRLLLVQSDLSALTHQIDELVVKAFELKEMDKQGRKEIESFTHVLSDMLSSLKVAMLAKQCVDEDSILRPDMKQVVISLSQILLSSIEWEATLAGNSQVFSGLVQGR